MTPEAFYLVTTTFPKDLGWGASDPVVDRDAAYNQYAEAVRDGQPTAAFMIEKKAYGGWSIYEITEDFRDEYETICERRDIALAAE